MPAEPIIFGRIALVPLPGWKFFPQETQVIGRKLTRVGGIEISLRFLDHSPTARSHFESLHLANQALPSEDVSPPYSFDRIRWGPCYFGGASYNVGSDFLRLWYVHKDSSLVPIVYACKRDQRMTHDAMRELVEAEQMAAGLTILPAFTSSAQAPMPSPVQPTP